MAQEAEQQQAEGQEPEATEPKQDQGKQPESQTFDADYVKQLRSEAASNRKRAQEAEARVEELNERDQSELEKLTGKLTKAEQRAQDAEGRLLRFEVAATKNVPANAVDRLHGTTREELEADADQLLELVKAPEQAQPDFDGGARDPAPEPKSPEDAHNDDVLKLLGIAPNT